MVKNAGWDPSEMAHLPGVVMSPRAGTAEGSDGGMRPPAADVGTVYGNASDPYKSSQTPTTSVAVQASGTEATDMFNDRISGVNQSGPGQSATAGDQSGHVVTPHHPNATRVPLEG